MNKCEPSIDPNTLVESIVDQNGKKNDKILPLMAKIMANSNLIFKNIAQTYTISPTVTRTDALLQKYELNAISTDRMENVVTT